MGLPAISISLLIHGIFALLAIFFFYKWVEPPEEPKVDFLPGGGGGGSGGETAHRVQTRMQQLAASPALSRKVTVEGAASFTLPEPSAMMDVGLPMDSMLGSAGAGGGTGGGRGAGDGTGVGGGRGPGAGPGSGFGFGMSTTPFGSKQERPSALKGFLYDLKQNPEGKGTPGAVASMARIPESAAFMGPRVAELVRKNFSDDSVKDYLKAPDALYLSNLAIPVTDAAKGPELFGAKDKMQPSGWVAHYRGRLKAPKAMHFRFVAYGDDFVIVRVKGQTRMIAAYHEMRKHLYGRWEPSDTDRERRGLGWSMTNGDWISLRKGETFDIEITVGECPGGHVALMLLVEERRGDYRSDRDGFPILPIFTTEPISPEIRSRIEGDFRSWGEFEWDPAKVPVFLSADMDDRFTNPFR